MALSTQRLKDKIIVLLNECREETDNPDASRDKFAEKLAQAIVEEIQQLQINYTSGLVAPNGAVTGTINATIS